LKRIVVSSISSGARVGGGVGPPGLAEHALDLGTVLIRRIGLLQQLAGLGHGKARQRRRHVQQVAFVERRHELAAEAQHRHAVTREHDGATQQRRLGNRSTASSAGR
jgi:hypothetical protein